MKAPQIPQTPMKFLCPYLFKIKVKEKKESTDLNEKTMEVFKFPFY
jgi:hypothetical protein